MPQTSILKTLYNINSVRSLSGNTTNPVYKVILKAMGAQETSTERRKQDGMDGISQPATKFLHSLCCPLTSHY